MRLRLLAIVAVILGCLTVSVVFNTTSSLSSSTMSTNNLPLLDGTAPPHAVDIDGKTIPDSSVNQPDKPIILSKDSGDPKWGELKFEAAFDHTKHNTDVMHTLDGKTLTNCVYCHHTEQPMPVAGKPYLKKSERSEALTATQLETSKQAVNSCRHCHFQSATAPTAEFPPESVTYPREMRKEPSGKLTNDNAYHSKCIDCHEAATTRDPKLKAPIGCSDCHKNKLTRGTATSSPTPKTSSKSLYERLGGYDAIAAVVDDFISRLIADNQFEKFFAGQSTDSRMRIRQNILDQFCAAAGGPCVYTGRDMKTAHKSLGITTADWDAAAKHLGESLDKFKVPKAEKDELLAFVTNLKKDIVEK